MSNRQERRRRQRTLCIDFVAYRWEELTDALVEQAVIESWGAHFDGSSSGPTDEHYKVEAEVTSQAEQIAALQQIIENMATQHVTFGVKGSRKKIHPDWCPLCRLEKAEQIGSPEAIAVWVEQTVIPMLGAKMNLPEKSVAKGAVHQGCSAGDLIKAIRESQVFP